MYVPVFVVLEEVEYEVCAWSSVEDVAEYVQFVDGEPLYDVGDGYDEVVSATCVDDCVDDSLYVGCFVDVVGALV